VGNHGACGIPAADRGPDQVLRGADGAEDVGLAGGERGGVDGVRWLNRDQRERSGWRSAVRGG
jgi:hypothetical protein